MAYVQCACQCSALAQLVFGLDGSKKLWQADWLEEMTTSSSAQCFHNRGQVQTGNHQKIVSVFAYHEWATAQAFTGEMMRETDKFPLRLSSELFLSALLDAHRWLVRSYFVIMWGAKCNLRFSLLVLNCQKLWLLHYTMKLGWDKMVHSCEKLQTTIAGMFLFKRQQSHTISRDRWQKRDTLHD